MHTAETRQQRRHRQRQEKKQSSYRPQKNAFRRALVVFKERAEALKAAAIMGPIAAKLALMDLAMRLGAYKSRGKGRGTPARSYNLAAGRSRYMPHQSERECLRRRLGGFGHARWVTQHYERQRLAA